MTVIRIRTNVAKVMISNLATVDNKISLKKKPQTPNEKVKQKQCI